MTEEKKKTGEIRPILKPRETRWPIIQIKVGQEDHRADVKVVKRGEIGHQSRSKSGPRPPKSRNGRNNFPPFQATA